MLLPSFKVLTHSFHWQSNLDVGSWRPWLAEHVMWDLSTINVLHIFPFFSSKNSQGHCVSFVTPVTALHTWHFSCSFPSLQLQGQHTKKHAENFSSLKSFVLQTGSSWNKQMRTGKLWQVCTAHTKKVFPCAISTKMTCAEYWFYAEMNIDWTYSGTFFLPKLEFVTSVVLVLTEVWYVTADGSWELLASIIYS